MEKFSSAFTWAIGLLETKRTALNSIVCLLKQASLLQEKGAASRPRLCAACYR